MEGTEVGRSVSLHRVRIGTSPLAFAGSNKACWNETFAWLDTQEREGSLGGWLVADINELELWIMDCIKKHITEFPAKME